MYHQLYSTVMGCTNPLLETSRLRISSGCRWLCLATPAKPAQAWARSRKGKLSSSEGGRQWKGADLSFWQGTTWGFLLPKACLTWPSLQRRDCWLEGPKLFNFLSSSLLPCGNRGHWWEEIQGGSCIAPQGTDLSCLPLEPGGEGRPELPYHRLKRRRKQKSIPRWGTWLGKIQPLRSWPNGKAL